MAISQNSFVGSFVLSFFTPWRTNDKSDQDFVARPTLKVVALYDSRSPIDPFKVEGRSCQHGGKPQIFHQTRQQASEVQAWPSKIRRHFFGVDHT
jgi:hypothetical protein